jgi:hypothetical protein
MDKLLDINYIKKHTPDYKTLKVALKRDKIKGNSLFANRNIRKGEVLAYYKMRVYNKRTYESPFGNTYLFTVYTKSGRSDNKLVADLYECSIDPPKRGIPYWAYFSNEPSGTQEQNSMIDADEKNNYKNRDRVKQGDTLVYKLIATRSIKRGEEIVWCYGGGYDRNYEPNC